MSRIEWTNETWNPVRGCSRVSAGCMNCYAERMAHRFSGPGQPYEGLTTIRNGRPGWTGEVRFVSEQLDAPIRWRKPRMVFVNSMSDLFHEKVTDEQIDDVFGVMWACEYLGLGEDTYPGHTFQILTKRTPRLLDYMSQNRRERWAYAAARNGCAGEDPDPLCDQIGFAKHQHPRIWLGVSVENQAAADERIPLLLQTPAAIRWVSAEPLLGPIQFNENDLGCKGHIAETFGNPMINWVVVGGESGPGARPMDEDWVRSIRDQCVAAGVPLFYKQRIDGGRKVSLPLLDGVRWDRFPDP